MGNDEHLDSLDVSKKETTSEVMGKDEHLDSLDVSKKETTSEVMERVQLKNKDQSEDEMNNTVDLNEDIEGEKEDNTEDGLPEAGSAWKLARLSPR